MLQEKKLIAFKIGIKKGVWVIVRGKNNLNIK